MADHDPLTMGVVNEFESETTLTKFPNFAKGDVAIAFHVICQERVGVLGRASVEWRKHLPAPRGQGVLGIMGDGLPQAPPDAGVVGWTVDGLLGVVGIAPNFNFGTGVLGISGQETTPPPTLPAAGITVAFSR